MSSKKEYVGETSQEVSHLVTVCGYCDRSEVSVLISHVS